MRSQFIIAEHHRPARAFHLHHAILLQAPRGKKRIRFLMVLIIYCPSNYNHIKITLHTLHTIHVVCLTIISMHYLKPLITFLTLIIQKKRHEKVKTITSVVISFVLIFLLVSFKENKTCFKWIKYNNEQADLRIRCETNRNSIVVLMMHSRANVLRLDLNLKKAFKPAKINRRKGWLKCLLFRTD